MSPALALMAWLDGRYVRGPFDRSWWWGFGYVGARPLNGSCVVLSDIWTEERHRGQGHAARVLREMCDEADRLGCTLVTWAQPFDRGSRGRRTTKQLTRWYERLGFNRRGRGEDCDRMYRSPR